MKIAYNKLFRAKIASMKGEKQTTVRQDWVEFSGSAQQDVNQTLADLQLEIEIANARLAQLHNEDPE